jgi:hypothetical protein
MSDQVSCYKVQGCFHRVFDGRGHQCRPVVMTAARCSSLPFGLTLRSSFCAWHSDRTIRALAVQLL